VGEGGKALLNGSTLEDDYLTLRISFSLPIKPKPMSRTSGHILTMKITNNTERTVVSTRTLENIENITVKTAK
jgi:hypothetical protein